MAKIYGSLLLAEALFQFGAAFRWKSEAILSEAKLLLAKGEVNFPKDGKKRGRPNECQGHLSGTHPHLRVDVRSRTIPKSI